MKTRRLSAPPRNRAKKPMREELTIKLSQKQTAENLIAVGQLLNQAQAQYQATNEKFQDTLRSILTENGIDTAEFVSATKEPPAVKVVVTKRLKK